MGAVMGRRRLSKDARRAELLRAGERVFSERAFDDASIDDIAAEAGISKNLLYHYFAGKRELLLEVIRDSTERMLAATEPDLDLDPMDRLRASLDAHLDYAAAHATGYIAVLRGAGADEEVLAIISAAQNRVVTRTIATLPWPDGHVPAEVLLAMRGWLGMIDSLTLYWLEHQDVPKDRVLELLVELFVAVLTTAGAVAARIPAG